MYCNVIFVLGVVSCLIHTHYYLSAFLLLSHSRDEDEELHSADPESKEKSKDKKLLCKVKWSRDEVRGLEVTYRVWSGYLRAQEGETETDSVIIA